MADNFILERTWGRDEGTPDLKNIKDTNNVENTGLTENQRQIQLLKNIDNKNILRCLGYCKKPEPLRHHYLLFLTQT